MNNEAVDLASGPSGMTTAGTPVTASLAAWVATVAVQDVPAPVRERARHLLLDARELPALLAAPIAVLTESRGAKP